MTDKEHLAKWGRPITVDHKNGRRNTLANLQTLCLRCHGMKDGNRQPSKLRNRRQQVMDLTLAGLSCNSIAKRLKVGCRVVTKWIRRWNQGKL
jgi:transposase-like protein